MTDPDIELISQTISLVKNSIPTYQEELPRILASIELGLSKTGDHEELLDGFPLLFRRLVDITSMTRVFLTRKGVELQRETNKLEIMIRDQSTKKLTISEVNATMWENYPHWVELHTEVENAKTFLEHLKDLKSLAFARKDILIERSIDLRSQRKEDQNAI